MTDDRPYDMLTIERFRLVETPPLTAETIWDAARAIEAHDAPLDYTAVFPAALADAAIAEFGGRLEPCRRPGLEAYDEIVDHREGRGLIVLVERD